MPFAGFKGDYQSIQVLTSGGSGNVTVHVSFGEAPTLDSYDYRSARPGNNESIRIATPQAGSYYILVVGDKEKEAGAVAVRARGNKDLGVLALEDFSALILAEIANKA